MIPHETANSFLRLVYRDGLDRAKSVYSEQAKSGDRIARKLLNVVGLYEQGHGREVRLQDLTESDRGFRPAELAGYLRCVLESRKRTLLVDRLAGELVEGDLPIRTAVETLL